MPNIKWTGEQEKILNTEGNIIVSAAAGSGKTAVLTEKIVRKVESGIPICDMLVVTFTTAAAAEMKQRIEKKLYEHAEAAKDDKARSFLYAQAQSTSRADISTLHSFCTHVLRRHFYEAELSPTFRVGDSTELEMLHLEALDEALNEYFENAGDKTRLLNALSGEDNLIKVINTLYENMRVQSDGKEKLIHAGERYHVTAEELKESAAVNELASYVREYMELAVFCTEESLKIAQEPKHIDILERRLNILVNILNNIQNTDNIYESLSIKLPSFQGAGKIPPEIKYYNGIVKNCLETSAELFDSSLYEFAKELNLTADIVDDIIKITLKFDELFSQKKSKHSIIDFNDMEQLTLKLLKNDAIASIYRNRFKLVFVDEYQDINDIQNEIIHLLLSEDNAFFVGDIKQSIYRFRHARPELFLEKMQTYENENGSHSMGLSANFRSSEPVVDFVNSIFAPIMRRETGDIDYDGSHRLVKESKCTGGNTYLHLIDRSAVTEIVKDTDCEDEDIKEILDIEAQAALCVDIIRDMTEKCKFYDSVEDCERSYRYSDFAIIMRSLGKSASIFARELILAGIPVYINSNDGYFDAIEVQVFTGLLSILDNRRQDIPLISVMRSCIGNFSMEEIAQIRLTANENMPDNKNLCFFDALVFVSEAELEISEKLKTFISKLDSWYELSRIMPLEEFIRTLLDETGFYRFTQALPGGTRRVLNLDTLAAIAGKYEKNINKGLYDFLNYLESAKEHSKIEDAAQETGTDAVHILTMHKSKGLEFNVVIVPELQKKIISKHPSSEIFLFDEDYIGARLTTNGITSKNIYHKLLVMRKTREHIADELRLLYVTFTRARDTLHLIAAVADTNKLVSSNAVPQAMIVSRTLSSSVYIEWIILALLNSSHAQILNIALSDGAAGDKTLGIDITSPGIYSLSGKKKDEELFEAELERIRGLNSDEADADLNWQYPHLDALGITSKGSVTGFAKAASTAVFSRESADDKLDLVSAAQRGTATHLLFELLPISPHTQADIEEFAKGLVSSGRLTQDEFNSLNIKGIAEFFKRPLAARIQSSDKVYREKSFACFIEANVLSEDCKSDENVLVQGIIDCCFAENGKWVIVDYKTDSVNKNDAEQVKNQAYTHKKQLELYKYVLEKLTGMAVSECWISFVNAYDVQVI